MRTCVLTLFVLAKCLTGDIAFADEQETSDAPPKSLNSTKDNIAPVQTIVGPVENWNGRVLEWKLGAAQLAAEQAETLAVKETAGTLSLSFSHAGYTAEDPDGKHAVLTVTVLRQRKPLTKDETEQLETLGYILSDRMAVLPVEEWELNLHLPAEEDEEERLRREQQLPRKIDVGLQPISLRWKNVPGKDLHKWLTDDRNGLTVAIAPFTDASQQILVETKFTRTSQADSSQLRKWWDKHAAGNVTYQWRGGVGPLTVSIIEFGCIKTSEGNQLQMSDAFFEAEQLSSRLKQVVSVDRRTGVFSIDEDKFDKLDWAFSREYRVRASTTVQPNVHIGKLLLEHPELVRDLTGTGRGLEALLQDSQ